MTSAELDAVDNARGWNWLSGTDYRLHMPHRAQRASQERMKEQTRNGKARYGDWLTDREIHELEQFCLTSDKLNVITGDLNSGGIFWRECNRTIGWSKGEETTLVLAKLDMHGNYHGQPILKRELDRATKSS